MKPLYANIKCENTQQLIKRYIALAMLLRGVKVSENEVMVLAYFMQHGINSTSKQELVNVLKLAKNMSTLKSMLSKLRAKGLIIKQGYAESLCKDLTIDYKSGINIVLNFFT